VFSSAVVATDLGPASEGIVACAGALGTLGVREAVLVYAIDLQRGPSSADDAVFARQAASLEEAGIKVHVETPLGYAPHAIASLALERGAGLIVMGTSGQGLFHTGFSGSVSSDVVRLSTVPVLLTPGPIAATAAAGGGACARLLTSVLMPVDLTDAADRLCSLACSLSSRGIDRIEILHVVELSFDAVRESREDRAEAMLGALAERARAANMRDVRTTVARGAPDEVVAKYAASGDYSLIIVAPTCHETIDQVFGSVASAVIRSSSTPILLAPPGCEPVRQPRGNT
jgi:nucleotide-binding universal stress UspA family protein